MANFANIQVFEGKSFEDILKEIYTNSVTQSKRIEALISELRILITDSRDASIIAPLIKGYLDAGVKNDEHLIKMLAIIQRSVTNSPDGSGTLTDEEKDELMKTADELQKEMKANA